MKKISILLFAWICAMSNMARGQNFVFENLGIPISEKDSIQIVDMIRYQMDFYNRISPIDFAHVKLKIFDDSTEYAAVRRNSTLSETFKIGAISGFFSPRDSIAYVFYIPQKRSEHLPLIYHEIAHYFTHLTISRTYQPRWLNEGLSRYFQHSETTKKKGIVHNLNSNTRGRIRTMVKLKQIDLKNVMSSNFNNFTKKEMTNENFTYIVAHGMVYFLIERDFEQFKAMMLEIKNGKSSFDAINITYPGGFIQFENDFMTYFGK
ncbi:MAG: DUF1570 domain-containing protein [Bacteroidales bacterium]|nr:DUF1570 domain-containing protein [Bacteroidales bacterium]